MAETNTFTVDTSPQTETLTDNLTTDEQDSLAVGEKMVAEQEQLLAGKYKDAQELEKAYMELQSKLGEKDKEDTETASATDDTPDEPKLSDGASLITEAQKEYYDNDNKLSDGQFQDLLHAIENGEMETSDDSPSGGHSSSIN